MKRTLIAAILALSACAAQPELPTSDPVQLRTYVVPDGSAGRLVGVLNRALHQRDAPDEGKAVEGPRGELIVVAPGEVQEGVAALIEGLGKTPAPPPPKNIEIDYWVVWGEPAAEVSFHDDLSPVVETLLTVSNTSGPMAYTPSAIRSIRSLDGEGAGQQGEMLGLRQVATLSPEHGTVLAEIELRYDDERLETRLELQPDTTIVLARAGEYGAPRQGTLFTLVRARVLD